jgi:hypothetical protein
MKSIESIPLDPYERWCVKSNLQSVRDGEPIESILTQLRANGYPRIAAAVEQEYQAARQSTD